MMFTCSAFRCSVFDGSGISRTSNDAGADDPLAPQCIPDSVLYVTVDDEAFVDMFRDFEHAAQLSFDAPRHVRARGGREFDFREVVGRDRLKEMRARSTLRIGGEKAVHGPAQNNTPRAQSAG